MFVFCIKFARGLHKYKVDEFLLLFDNVASDILSSENRTALKKREIFIKLNAYLTAMTHRRLLILSTLSFIVFCLFLVYIGLNASANSAPVLKDGQVSPQYYSNPSSVFYFNVTYTQADGIDPKSTNLYFSYYDSGYYDSYYGHTHWVNYVMTYSDGSASTGELYTYSTSSLPSSSQYQYYFSFTANISGQTQTVRLPTSGAFSGPIIDTTAPASSVSSLSPYTNTSSFTVSWSGSDGSGSSIKSYDVQYKIGSGGTWSNWLTGTTVTSATFGPTTPVAVQDTVIYYFRCRATDNAGNQGTYSNGDTSTQIDLVGRVADTTAPTSSVSSLPPYTNTSSFTVIWSGNDAVSGIKSYDVQYKIGSGGTWSNWLTGTTVTSATFGPTTPVAVQDTAIYYFRCRATDNAGNQGTYSNGDTSTQIDLVGTPGQMSPTLTKGQVSPSAGAIGSTIFYFNVTYTQKNGIRPTSAELYLSTYNSYYHQWWRSTCTHNYAMTYSDGSASTGELYTYSTTSLPSSNNNQYQYYFSFATSISGQTLTARLPASDAFSGPIIDTTAPTSSVDPLPSTTITNSFTVSWNGSDNSDGSGVKWYDVQYKEGATGTWKDWKTQTTLTSAVFDGSSGKTYYFQCRGQDNAGNWGSYPNGNGNTYTTVSNTTNTPTSNTTNTATSNTSANGNQTNINITNTNKSTGFLPGFETLTVAGVVWICVFLLRKRR